jgi:GNAT superfamily N-acetyltransferase
MAPPTFSLAMPEDLARIAELRNAAAEKLTAEFGRGHWSGCTTAEKLAAVLERSRIYVLRERGRIMGTLRLQPKKPSEYDRPWFTRVRRPLFLYDMAVDPGRQRRGLGRACIEGAIRVARAWPADAIRLDAYDHAAGAGPFYEKCGFREASRRVFFRAPIIYYEMIL